MAETEERFMPRAGHGPRESDAFYHSVGVVTEHDAETKRKAARFVASNATDADDAAELLAALGLTAQDGA